MTKADLAEKVRERLDYRQEEALAVVELILELLKEAIATEGRVLVSGFGNFIVKQKNARRGRNPQTGEEIIINPRRVLSFKASPVLKDKVNQG